MKKSYFIWLSALVLGVVVACTSQVEECEEVTNQQEILSLQEKHSSTETDWSAFQDALDSLNAQYFPNKPTNGSRFLVGIEVGTNNRYATEDAKGATTWLEIIRWLPDGRVQVEPSTVVMSVLYSFEIYDREVDTAHIGLTHPILSPNNILKLRSTNPFARVGRNHNIVIEKLLQVSGVFDMSRQQLISTIIGIYEQEIGSILPVTENALLSRNANRTPSLSAIVQQVNDNFTIAVAAMDMQTKRSYTDDYLQVVETSVANTYDMWQMAAHAAVMYYSSSLWNLE
jgi:hypothetical protein